MSVVTKTRLNIGTLSLEGNHGIHSWSVIHTEIGWHIIVRSHFTQVFNGINDYATILDVIVDAADDVYGLIEQAIEADNA